MICWLKYRLKSTDAAVRRAAAISISRLLTDQAFSLLKACLDDRDTGVVQEAINGIASFEDDSAASTLREALQHQNAEVRKAAASAIGKKLLRGAEDQLARMLKDSSPAVRQSAARALARLGWHTEDPELQAELDVLSGNPRAAVNGNQLAINPLVEGLKHDTAFVRRAVAEALEYAGDPRAVDSLIAAAEDPDDSVRISVIHALGKVVDEPKSRALLKQLLADTNPKVRLAATEVLTGRGTADDAETMIPLLRDKHFEVRVCAARFAGKLKNRSMVPHLLPLLADSDCDVRRTAADALGACGCRSSIQRLILSLADEDRGVRQAAATALCAIDPDWRRSDHVQSVSAELQSILNRRPAWVRAAASQLLSPAPEGPLLLRMAAR